MSYGAIFKVGRARVLETLLMSPEVLESAARSRDYGAASNIIMSGAFGRKLDEKAADFGIGKILNDLAGSFSPAGSRDPFFTTDVSGLLDVVESVGLHEIKDALYGSRNPFEFYGFAYGKRMNLRGEIEGVDVIRYIWLCLLWQARLVRMILASQKMRASNGYKNA